MDERERDDDRMREPDPGAAGGVGGAGAANTPPFETGTPAGEPLRAESPESEGIGGTGSRRNNEDAAEWMEGIAPASPERADEERRAESAGAFRERLSEARFRAENRINQTLAQTADGLENAARQLDQFASRQASGATGATARAGRMAHDTAGTMDSVASYLRDTDAESLQRDLEDQVRTRPVQTLLIGLAAGWIIGKILR